MKKKFPMVIERGRVLTGQYASPIFTNYGAFEVDGPCGVKLTIIVFPGEDGVDDPESALSWEHVSISTAKRCPYWEEMQWAKENFFNDDEVVMQLHPAKNNYVNNHPFTLHLWRPRREAIPLPPLETV